MRKLKKKKKKDFHRACEQCADVWRTSPEIEPKVQTNKQKKMWKVWILKNVPAALESCGAHNFKYHDLNFRLSRPPYEQRNLFIFSRRTRTALAQAWTVHTPPEANGQNREGSVLPSSPPRLAALHNFPPPYHHRANGNVGQRTVPAPGQLDARCRRCRLFGRWERVDESRRVRAACVPSAPFAGQKCWKGGISPTRDLWWRDATV